MFIPQRTYLMHIHRRTFCPIAAKAALALGALSWLVFAPQTAFAGPTLTDLTLFNSANGSTPNSGVTLDSAGNLYGTALYGGSNGDGAVYEIAKGTGVIHDLAAFDNTNGANPYGGVTLDSSGNLFGTTAGDGSNNKGTVYEITGAATPVPEASSALSFGLLLTLSTGGLLLCARRQKGAASAQASAETE